MLITPIDNSTLRNAVLGTAFVSGAFSLVALLNSAGFTAFRVPVGGLLGFVDNIYSYVLLFWFYNIYKNLNAIGVRDFRYTSVWVWLSFIIPIINLVRPFQIAINFWELSHQHSEPKQPAEEQPIAIYLWWAGTVVGWCASICVTILAIQSYPFAKELHILAHAAHLLGMIGLVWFTREMMSLEPALRRTLIDESDVDFSEHLLDE